MTRQPDDTRILSEVGFVHLHVHSSYSLLEGALMIGTLAKMAAADGLECRIGRSREPAALERHHDVLQTTKRVQADRSLYGRVSLSSDHRVILTIELTLAHGRRCMVRSCEG